MQDAFEVLMSFNSERAAMKKFEQRILEHVAKSQKFVAVWQSRDELNIICAMQSRAFVLKT